MRWTVGLLIGFAAMLLANGLLLWYATHGAPEIETSYTTEAR